MSFLKNVLNSFNQMTNSVGPRFVVNHKLKRYGHMTELAIDPDKKIVTATLQLKGEKEPIHLRLSRYQLQTIGTADTLLVEEVYVSREWMQTLAADLLQNKPITLPPDAAKWLKMIL